MDDRPSRETSGPSVNPYASPTEVQRRPRPPARPSLATRGARCVAGILVGGTSGGAAGMTTGLLCQWWSATSAGYANTYQPTSDWVSTLMAPTLFGGLCGSVLGGLLALLPRVFSRRDGRLRQFPLLPLAVGSALVVAGYLGWIVAHDRAGWHAERFLINATAGGVAGLLVGWHFHRLLKTPPVP